MEHLGVQGRRDRKKERKRNREEMNSTIKKIICQHALFLYINLRFRV